MKHNFGNLNDRSINYWPLGSLSLRCRWAHRRLEEYTRGHLNPALTNKVASHLERCASCQAEYETLFTIRCVLDAYPRIQAAPNFDLKVLQSIRPQPAPTPAFFDRLDTLFARPAYKLIGSTALGFALSMITAGLVMLPYALSSHLLWAKSVAGQQQMSPSLSHQPTPGTRGTGPVLPETLADVSIGNTLSAAPQSNAQPVPNPNALPGNMAMDKSLNLGYSYGDWMRGLRSQVADGTDQ